MTLDELTGILMEARKDPAMLDLVLAFAADQKEMRRQADIVRWTIAFEAWLQAHPIRTVQAQMGKGKIHWNNLTNSEE